MSDQRTPAQDALLSLFSDASDASAAAAPEDSLSEEKLRDDASIWAELGLAAAPETPPSGHRARVMLAVLGRNRYPPAIRDALKRMYGFGDAPLDELIDRINQAREWHATPLPGIDALSLDGSAPSLADFLETQSQIAVLVRFAPGAEFPLHQHLGDERVLVLEGGFTTNDGKQISAGETLHMPPGSEHSFVADPGEDCIAASLATAGIRLG